MRPEDCNHPNRAPTELSPDECPDCHLSDPELPPMGQSGRRTNAFEIWWSGWSDNDNGYDAAREAWNEQERRYRPKLGGPTTCADAFETWWQENRDRVQHGGGSEWDFAKAAWQARGGLPVPRPILELLCELTACPTGIPTEHLGSPEDIVAYLRRCLPVPARPSPAAEGYSSLAEWCDERAAECEASAVVDGGSDWWHAGRARAYRDVAAKMREPSGLPREDVQTAVSPEAVDEVLAGRTEPPQGYAVALAKDYWPTEPHEPGSGWCASATVEYGDVRRCPGSLDSEVPTENEAMTRAWAHHDAVSAPLRAEVERLSCECYRLTQESGAGLAEVERLKKDSLEATDAAMARGALLREWRAWARPLRGPGSDCMTEWGDESLRGQVGANIERLTHERDEARRSHAPFPMPTLWANGSGPLEPTGAEENATAQAIRLWAANELGRQLTVEQRQVLNWAWARQTRDVLPKDARWMLGDELSPEWLEASGAECLAAATNGRYTAWAFRDPEGGASAYMQPSVPTGRARTAYELRLALAVLARAEGETQGLLCDSSHCGASCHLPHGHEAPHAAASGATWWAGVAMDDRT